MGRSGSFSPALKSAMASTTASSAPRCPTTRSPNAPRTASRVSVAEGETTKSGSPEWSANTRDTKSGSTGAPGPPQAGSARRSITRSSRPLAGPGAGSLGRNRAARSVSATSVGGSREKPALSAQPRSTAAHSAGPSGGTFTRSKRPRMPGVPSSVESCSGVTSPISRSRPC